MLKKLTATGILAGAAVVLLTGPVQASTVSDVPAECYSVVPGYIPPAWCANYLQNPYYQPPAYYPPTTTYVPVPSYGWHHGGWRGPHHWHR